MNIKALRVKNQADQVSTILKLAEAAKLIRVSEKTLGAMARDRRIPAQKVGREWRFLLPAIEDWLMGMVPGEKIAEPLAAYRQAPLFADHAPEDPHRSPSFFGDTAFTKNRREPLHRWVPWIAGFSADFVERVLETTVKKASRHITVLDPFAGVGTTLIEGLKRGYNVVGFEINPYAALACRTKLEAWRCDLNQVEATIRRMETVVSQQKEDLSQSPTNRPPPLFKSRIPFFSPSIQRQVLFIKDFIDGIDDGLVKDLFRVALGSVMVGFSNYSYEPSLCTRASAGRNGIDDADSVKVLSSRLWEIAADIGFLQKHLARFDYRPECRVFGMSFLETGADISNSRADVLITSPPYLNNYHYIRNTRPQLYWLDLMNQSEAFKQMEALSFGQFWQTARSAPKIALRVSIPELDHTLELVSRQHPEKGEYGGQGWANYAAAYFNDCDRFCAVTKRVMKPSGAVVVVIGNNILQGVEIKTDVFFSRIAEQHGFKVVDLHRVRKKRTGSSIINSSVRAATEKKRCELYETAVELRAPA
jgi:excisionase family DNA binding protein